MPTKTTIFTSLEKFDGSGMRMLYSHEYTQMAGRAGRRGLDKVGSVIHLNNLFKNVNLVSYKQMMCGKPQTLVSKFKISYNLILSLIDVGDKNFTDFAKRSMIQDDIDSELGSIYYKMTAAQTELDKLYKTIAYLKTPMAVMTEYIELNKNVMLTANKKRKEIERRMKDIQNEYFSLDKDLVSAKNYISVEKEITDLQNRFSNTEQFLNKNVMNIFSFLKSEGFVIETDNDNDTDTDTYTKINLTFKGSLASNLREVHCLVFANLLEQKVLEDFESSQIVAILSCFTNITTSEDKRELVPNTSDKKVQNMILQIRKSYDQYVRVEDENNMDTGVDYNMHFDLINYIAEWCESENAEQCKCVLQKMEREKDIFLGEFVKALLKINNISSEMEKIAEKMGSISFLSKLREIPVTTLKYVATNQSLYI
jgi:superfamily II RNA helicase